MSLKGRLAPYARTTVKAGAALGDLVRRPPRGITILIYHRVGAGAGGEMDLSPADFDAQLGWLRSTQRLLTLDDAVAELRDTPSSGVTRPGVVLTFDDGTTDWVDQVLPALERHRAPATFYVATSFVDEGTEFPGRGRPLSWGALGELASSPLVTIGSHTHRHLLLDRLAADEIDDELDRSVELLEDHLDAPIRHFAYPKALAGSPAADRAVRARFDSAAIAGTRANVAGGDLFRLHRSPVQSSDGDEWFRRKAVGGLHLEDDLRQVANRYRYRRLSA